MKRTLFLAALTSLTSLAATAGFAGNAGSSLPSCYNHVINACNQNSDHPQDCAEAGMNACDEYHAANLPAEGLQIKIRELGNGKYKASFPGAAKPKREHERGEAPERTAPARDADGGTRPAR